MELPKHIIRKLERISQKNFEIFKLVREINRWEPELGNVGIEPKQWTWNQYFFGNNYSEVSVKNMVVKIKSALEEIEKQGGGNSSQA